MTALQAVLEVFAAGAQAPWSAFDRVPGLAWADPAPQPEERSRPQQPLWYRGGELLLEGFADAWLPDGVPGAEAGQAWGNEGRVGATLHGDDRHVHSLVLVKFEASEDYQQVLQRQLAPGAEVAALAGQCAFGEDGRPPNGTANAFFRVTLANGATLYAEGCLDDADDLLRGPGCTYYWFYREEPSARIQSMGCQRR